MDITIFTNKRYVIEVNIYAIVFMLIKIERYCYVNNFWKFLEENAKIKNNNFHSDCKKTFCIHTKICVSIEDCEFYMMNRTSEGFDVNVYLHPIKGDLEMYEIINKCCMKINPKEEIIKRDFCLDDFILRRSKRKTFEYVKSVLSLYNIHNLEEESEGGEE
jgi:hypothetical protein